MRVLFIFYLCVVAIGCTLLLWGCKAPEYGCSKRQQQKSRKHFVKSVNFCQTEAMAQSLLFFPFGEKDSSWSDYARGVDTLWLPSAPVDYDCDKFIRERDSLARLGVKTTQKASVKCPDCPYTVDTVKKYLQKLMEDKRRIGILENALTIANQKEADMAVKLSEKNVAIVKMRAEKNIYRNILLAIVAIIGLAVGVKIFKLKIPFLG